MKTWEEGFRRMQPGIRFKTKLPGTEAAMAGLYGGGRGSRVHRQGELPVGDRRVHRDEGLSAASDRDQLRQLRDTAYYIRLMIFNLLG